MRTKLLPCVCLMILCGLLNAATEARAERIDGKCFSFALEVSGISSINQEWVHAENLSLDKGDVVILWRVDLGGKDDLEKWYEKGDDGPRDERDARLVLLDCFDNYIATWDFKNIKIVKWEPGPNDLIKLETIHLQVDGKK